LAKFEGHQITCSLSNNEELFSVSWSDTLVIFDIKDPRGPAVKTGVNALISNYQ